MVRLIVDDAGSRRAFNVGEGRLSVGSAAEAKLKLASPGVASLHVDIEVHGGKATLHPRPGVTAPHLLGRAANGPVVLQHGVPVKIGGATLTVEYEGLPSKLSPAAAPPASGAIARKNARDREEKKDEHGRRMRKQGIPTWVWVAVGVPVLGVGGWFIASKMLGKNTLKIGEASAPAYYANALDRFKNAQYDKAEEQLALIPADAVIDAGLAAQVAKLREDIKTKVAALKVSGANEAAGKVYFGSQLEGFVKLYMSGPITSSEARVFMKRARYFREKWPTHPDLAWVARQEERFKAAIDLTKPPTFEDIEFEVKSLTWSHPRNYKEAFAVAKTFQATAAGADVQKIAGFLKELEGLRAAWFKDRLEQARWHFDRKEQSQSLGVLLSIIKGSGDDTMADDAAERLLKYGNAEEMSGWLRGYRSNDPDGFAEASKNRVIGAFIREQKIQ